MAASISTYLMCKMFLKVQENNKVLVQNLKLGQIDVKQRNAASDHNGKARTECLVCLIWGEKKVS